MKPYPQERKNQFEPKIKETDPGSGPHRNLKTACKTAFLMHLETVSIDLIILDWTALRILNFIKMQIETPQRS